MAFDESFARIWIVDENGWVELSEADKARILFAWIGTFRNYETIHLQVEEGLLDEDALERLGWYAFEPGFSAVKLWPDIARNLHPSFRAYVEDRHPALARAATD